MELKKQKLKLFYFAIFFLLLDMLSKWAAQEYLPFMHRDLQYYPYGGFGVFHDFLGIDFSLNYTINKGAAWGLFSNFHKTLLVLRIFVITSLILYIFVINKNLKVQFPLLLVATGALGNVVDTFIYGHVIDMFYFHFYGYSFPVFNIADSTIFIGVLWLFMIQIFKKKEDARSEASFTKKK